MSDNDRNQQHRPTTTGTATSRARTVRKAVRKPTKARLALSGSSGSGKTFTGLSIAAVLAPEGRTVLIDSEPSDDNNSASELYADLFNFDVIDWRNPPYDPRDLALTIEELGQFGDTDVLIVDSGSPFWRGQGGTLDIADGRFSGWKTATPAQDALIRAILNAPFHVIFCTRAKMDFAVDQSDSGRQKVTKLGLAPIQRDDLEYEFQVVVMLDTDHKMEISKTRCADLAGQSFPANQQAKFARILKEWLDRGPDVVRQVDVDLIVAALNGVTDKTARLAVKKAFAAEVGVPNQLEPAQLPAAWVWLEGRLVQPAHQYEEREPVEGDEDVVGPRCAVCGLTRRAGWHDASAAPRPSRPETPQVEETAAEEVVEEVHDEVVVPAGALVAENATNATNAPDPTLLGGADDDEDHVGSYDAEEMPF